MTHEKGHSETAEASAPADTSGAKNPIQQIKSTITYLKAVTFESICGLASTDANLDDDGNGSQSVDLIEEKDVIALEQYIEAVKADRNKFLAYMKVESLDEITKANYPKALNALKAKENKKVKKVLAR